MGCASSTQQKPFISDTTQRDPLELAKPTSALTDVAVHSPHTAYTAEIEQKFPVNIFEHVKFEIPPESEPIEISKGVTYRGQWVNGRQHGVGEIKYADGSVYLGEFREGKPHGRGKFTIKDGSVYCGHFVDGKAEGYGVYTDKDGSRYTGPYVADRREGIGREVQFDGLEYIGEYVKGHKHGKGELIAPNGEKYVGEFYMGEIHGFGTYTWPDGRVYTGQWEKNRQHGKAEFRWPDGRVYKGDYVNGRLQGYGVLEWKDGRKYDGHWKNGLQNGNGKYWGSPTWYREAQFLDGVRVKWLGDVVHVDENGDPQSNQSPVQLSPVQKGKDFSAEKTSLKQNSPASVHDPDDPKSSKCSPSTTITEEEALALKGTVAQRIAQFGAKASAA